MPRQTKDKRDIYYRRAKELGYRARSAFKLAQIDDEFNLISDAKRVVDLCAAPGGWSQILLERMGQVQQQQQQQNDENEPQLEPIVAVDLQAMAPLRHVRIIKGDITREQTAIEILEHFDGNKVELVVVDGAPDVVGIPDVDEYVQHTLLLAALHITTCLLTDGGAFVAKIFRGPHCGNVYAHLARFFQTVILSKPKACRNSSIEGFVVCKGFHMPIDFIPNLKISMQMNTQKYPAISVPFIACGSGYDADQSYPLDLPLTEEEEEIKSKQARTSSTIIMPINPPYQTALQRKRQGISKRVKPK